MRIAFFGPRYHSNLTDISRILINKGHDLEIFVLEKGNIENYTYKKPIVIESGLLFKLFSKLFPRLFNSGYNRKLQTISFIQTYKLLKVFAPEVVIIRNIDSPAAFICFCVSKFILRSKIIFYHQKSYKGFDNRRTKIISILNRLFSTQSFTPVLGDNNYLITNTANNHFIPFPIPPKLVNKNKVNSNVVKILTVAKFQTRKNIPLLLESLSRVEKSFHLTIVGQCLNIEHSNELKKVNDLITNYRLNTRVEIKMDIDHNRMGEVYSSNDIFILPSSNEPYSYSVLEAIGYGMPVICSDTCGSRYYVENGKNGHIFKSGDVNDLRNKIYKVMDRTEKYCVESNRIALMYDEEYFYNKFSKILYQI